jgi:Arc/MetJ-type ribon-helix-helix transcriptional regulator
MKTISLKLPEDLLVKLEHAAMQEGLSKSEVVRAALERVLNGQHKGKRSLSALDLAGDIMGSCKGPGDLSTNPKYMEGLGE